MRHGGGCQDVGRLSLRSSDQPGLGSRERGAMLLALVGLNCHRRTVDGGESRSGWSASAHASAVLPFPPPQRLLVLAQSRLVQCDFRVHINEAVICLRCLTRASDTLV